jgi:hypothetical protein
MAMRVPRVTNLKHSLAMVKGELGVWGAGASYVTIHGGLHNSLATMAELELKLEQKASSAQVNGLLLDTHHCQAKSAEACRAVEHLVNLGGATKVVKLEREFVAMATRMKTLEETLEKASKFVVDLSEYVSTLGASAPFASVAGGQQVQPSEFELFKKTCEMAFASMRQELKGGGIEVRSIVFEGEDACIAFAREHLSMLPTYDCIPSILDAMCMSSGEVVFKANMQGDEIHELRTGHAIPCSRRWLCPSTPPSHLSWRASRATRFAS